MEYFGRILLRKIFPPPLTYFYFLSIFIIKEGGIYYINIYFKPSILKNPVYTTAHRCILSYFYGGNFLSLIYHVYVFAKHLLIFILAIYPGGSVIMIRREKRYRGSRFSVQLPVIKFLFFY